jgi:hypothetical protein
VGYRIIDFLLLQSPYSKPPLNKLCSIGFHVSIKMNGPSLEELRDELRRLMLEHIESLKEETFLGLSQEELRNQEERLERIREVSADLLAALKRSQL